MASVALSHRVAPPSRPPPRGGAARVSRRVSRTTPPPPLRAFPSRGRPRRVRALGASSSDDASPSGASSSRSRRPPPPPTLTAPSSADAAAASDPATMASETVSSRRDYPGPARDDYATLAETLANNVVLRRKFTIGLKWWTPLSPLDGFNGVADACSRLWENTVLLSGLIASLSGFAIIFPIKEIIHAGGLWSVAYCALWSLAFAFCFTAGFSATILLNKICKCAPQNMSLWFTKFGGFVEVPQLFLYLGGWAAFGGCLVVLEPIYGNVEVLIVLSVFVFPICGSLVTTIYSQTTDFEKACARAAEKYGNQGSAEATIREAFRREVEGRDE